MARCRGAGSWEGPRRVGRQAEDDVGGAGEPLGTGIGTDIEAEPDKASDAAEADCVGTQAGCVAGGNAGHFSQVVHGSEFHVAGAGQLAHGVELTGNALASGDAGLGAASENFFDGVESAVIDALSEGKIERVGGRNVVEGQHLKGFEDGKRNVAERMDGEGIEGSCDGASPLQSEGGGDFLFGGKAKFFDPLTDFSITTQRRGPADGRRHAPDLVGLEKRRTCISPCNGDASPA